MAFAVAFCVIGACQPPALAQTGSRPAYIYDYADVISEGYESIIDDYVRRVDANTTAEIVIYTIPSFQGHGITKDGVEIQDRDMLANYIFNEVSLDGIKGIGKAGKNNGLLILYSIERDASGGSMRIEVGRGLEGDITDGTAGAILDAYLVPARQAYEAGDLQTLDLAFYNTVAALAGEIGYVDGYNPGFEQPSDTFEDQLSILIPVVIMAAIFVLAAFSKGRRRRRYYYGGYGGGWAGGGGGFGGGGGGGGSSGGGGAGR